MYCIEIRNRKIEMFLYAHGVDWISQEKDTEGLTVWKYADNKENRRIIDEYLQALAIRSRQQEEKRFKTW